MCALMCPRCGEGRKPRVQPLTPKQLALLAYVDSCVRDAGVAPSLKEMAIEFGYRSLATVHEHLTTLERKGWIRRRYNETRSIEVLVRPHDGYQPVTYEPEWAAAAAPPAAHRDV